MNIRTVVILSGIVVGIGAGAHVQGEPRMHLQVYPRISSSPADILISVGFPANADNRVLRVSAESEDFFRSSEIQIDGDNGPRVNAFTFRQLPSGSYDVEVRLIGSNGRTRQFERDTFMIQ